MINMLLVYYSSCDSFDRAVASNTRDLRFESSQHETLFSINCIEKMLIKKTEAWNGVI